MSITGSCLCGAIRYEVSGSPISTILCHCDNCRKATGSSFMANGFYMQSQLRVLAGHNSLKVYQDSATASGSTVSRSFCTNCGSSLFATNKDNPLAKDAVIIASGTMDLGPSAAEWAPQREFFCMRRREWLPPLENTQTSQMLESVENIQKGTSC
ncbi:hypothetical protein NUU61_000845 [Penicillium alfredii]|uniref:CENP-V/GFA domain-containing protein n=1 Tax=Penicillium alfredii TaxID=1506179 RepID=A0A9W9GAH9_9EURO|nr:uncharacterized protein NUU61_000845 [Penicillium alfredii]KAJ5115086.1 hypothetical protein NUU61_000845 [Penicillium alfredii]